MQTRLLLTLSFGFILSITSAYAQKPIRTVSISGGEQSNDFMQNVVSAVQARLNASTRYEITTEIAAELNISFSCIDMRKVAKNIYGGACSFLIVYYPDTLAGLSTIMTGPAIATGDASEIAETVFQDFVNVSTEDKLKTRLKRLHESIHVYEQSISAKAKP